MTGPFVVQSRLDTVTIEYVHEVGSSRFAEASRHAEGAATGQWVTWHPRDRHFPIPDPPPAGPEPSEVIARALDAEPTEPGIAVSYGRTRGALSFRTPWLRGKVTNKGIEVTAGAVACAMMSPDELAEHMNGFAGWFGTLEESTLRRCDLAVDVAGWEVDSIGLKDFVGSRARVAKSTELGGTLTQYATAGDCTGFTVAPGNAIKLNIYDKLRELRRPSSEHKAEMEFAAWKRSGWDGETSVTRVEVQLRTRVARELGITAADLGGNRDAVWQYVTRKWLRVVDLSTSSRRERAKPCAGWLAVQGAVFAREAEPAERVRPRSGPTAAGAYGTVRAFLAARGMLPLETSAESLTEAFLAVVSAELEAKHGTALPSYLRGRHAVALSTYGSSGAGLGMAA